MLPHFKYNRKKNYGQLITIFPYLECVVSLIYMREQCEKQRLGIHPTLLPPPGKGKRKKKPAILRFLIQVYVINYQAIQLRPCGRILLVSFC